MNASAPHGATVAALAERARRLVSDGERRILGIAGPPGAGKSTLAAALVTSLGRQAALVPMDGFHLSNAVLHAHGSRGRKGAPDTFDAEGYAALLRRLRAASGTVYAPTFDRDLDEPVAGSIAVPPSARLIVTEGNYLLHAAPPWPAVTACLDATWYVALDDVERRRRLIARHVRHGMSPEQAQRWTADTDEPNAELVAAGRGRADLVVTGTGQQAEPTD